MIFDSGLFLGNPVYAVTNKTNKYSQLSETHIFIPVAIETAGTWHHHAVELKELGRRSTAHAVLRTGPESAVHTGRT